MRRQKMEEKTAAPFAPEIRTRHTLGDCARNLRRLMARFGLTIDQVVAQSGLDQRTVVGVLRGASKPHPRTLQRLAVGLGVATDELFQDPSLLVHRLFDRQTNPVVQSVVESRPELFAGWNEAEFDELYSRFGVGGRMSTDGVLDAVQKMELRKEAQNKVAAILETEQAELMIDMIEAVYRRIVVEQ
jgi:transcriptional regulator with XRE-family HTH domain